MYPYQFEEIKLQNKMKLLHSTLHTPLKSYTLSPFPTTNAKLMCISSYPSLCFTAYLYIHECYIGFFFVCFKTV